jgi:hypothetical protein
MPAGDASPSTRRIDGAARIVTEDPGKLEGVAADEALDAVEDHRRVADAADRLGVGVELDQRRQLGRPAAIGVEDHRLRGNLSVKGVEYAGQKPLADLVVDKHRALGAGAGFGEHRAEELIDRAAHAGDKAWILPEQRGEQGRARARQAGNEVKAVLHGARPVARRAAQDAPLSL